MFRNLLYRECRGCGTPWIVSKLYKWGNNGTMGIKFQDIRRMALLNASMYDDIVEDMNLEVGVPIWHLVYESYRNVGRMSLEGMFDKNSRLKKLKKYKFVRKRIGTFFNELAVVMGVCHSRTGERLSNLSHTAYIKNPFNLYCVAGSVVSALEALRGIPYDCKWEELSLNEYKITVMPLDEKPEVCQRLIDEPPTILEGDVSLERCKSCGVPLRAAELFEWQKDEGKLINRKSGDRWCAFVTTSLRPIIRELAEELGDGIYDSLVASQSEWTIGHLGRLGITIDCETGSKEAEEAFLAYLKDFPVFGYGNPSSVKIEDGSCSITIENPFYEEMVAGILLGLYKGLIGEEAGIRWKASGENKVVYSIDIPGE
ncbi:MAG: hypothetical protein JXA49_02310 [Actinobacteria bacterium]|nr:hypothetical protein [Actinomycetota bacterium]